MQYHANKSIKKIAPVAAAAFVAAMLVGAFSFPAAWAAVTFDPITGQGFVGKGDIKDAFGLKESDMTVSNAEKVDFYAESSETWEFDCVWTTGPDHNRKTHRVDVETTTEVNSEVAKDVRSNKQTVVTGFTLTGLSGGSGSGDAPEQGDLCSEWVTEDADGEEINPSATVDNPQRVSGESSTTLYASYPNKADVALGTF